MDLTILKKKKTLYVLVGIVSALIGLVLLEGCMMGPEVTYDYSISQPYAVKSGVIEMRVNATARVTLNNSQGGELKFRIAKATMTAYMEDGSFESVEAQPSDGIVPAGGVADVNVTFNGLPVRYVLLDNPPRFHSLVGYYDVNVTYAGATKIFGFWTPEQSSVKSARIPLDDMPMGDYFSTILSKLSLR
jgi:hypothetical protein